MRKNAAGIGMLFAFITGLAAANIGWMLDSGYAWGQSAMIGSALWFGIGGVSAAIALMILAGLEDV